MVYVYMIFMVGIYLISVLNNKFYFWNNYKCIRGFELNYYWVWKIKFSLLKVDN